MDTGGQGIDASLAHRLPNVPMESAVAFTSQSIVAAEQNYSTGHKECLALIWVVTKLHPCLSGWSVYHHHRAPHPVLDPYECLGRWTLQLQEYDFVVRCKSERKHSDADSLSRCLRTTLSVQPLQLGLFPRLPPLPFTLLNWKVPDHASLIHHLSGEAPTTNMNIPLDPVVHTQ